MDPCPRLPVELHDHIIDFLFDRKWYLYTCSLVCRNWRIRSQYHLFCTIRVAHPRTLESFTYFLCSAPPHIATSIQDLALCGTGTDKESTHDVPLLVTTASIGACIALLPSLRTLSLESVWWGDAMHAKAEDTPRLVPRVCADSLQKLRMCKVLATPAGLFDTVCLFYTLDTLYIESVSWPFGLNRSDSSSDDPSLDRPTPRNLIVGPGCTHETLRCFLQTLHTRTKVARLQSLELELEHPDAWHELTDFLWSISPCLEYLSLKFGRFALPNGSSQPQLLDFRLSIFTALHSFAVSLPADEPGTCTWALLPHLLLQLPPSIHNLSITHHSHLDALASGIDWPRIDGMLTGVTFGDLKEVRVRGKFDHLSQGLRSSAPDSDDLWEYFEQYAKRTRRFFKEKLPLLDKRGMLELE